MNQERDILPSLAKWWYLNRKNIEPVKQIFPELMAADHQRQIPMRRRDKANVNMNGLVASQPLELLFLQRAQQLWLQFQTNVANFIQEQRAAIGNFKAAAFLQQSASERTLLMSEQFAFDKPGWNSSAIETYERSVSSWTEVMDCARNQFFPGARLAVQQDSRSGRGDNLYLVKDFTQSGALAYEILEVVFRADFRFEIQALVFQAIS